MLFLTNIWNSYFPFSCVLCNSSSTHERRVDAGWLGLIKFIAPEERCNIASKKKGLGFNFLFRGWESRAEEHKASWNSF